MTHFGICRKCTHLITQKDADADNLHSVGFAMYHRVCPKSKEEPHQPSLEELEDIFTSPDILKDCD